MTQDTANPITQTTLDGLELKLVQIEADKMVAAQNLQMEEITRLVLEGVEVAAEIAKVKVVVFGGRIAELTEAFKTEIMTSPILAELADLSGVPVKSLVYSVSPSKDPEVAGDIYSILINASPKTTRKKSTASGGRGAAKKLVTRVRADGSTEILTQKDVCQTYANDEIRALASWDKNFWTALFPKVNNLLGILGEPQFVDAPEPIEVPTTKPVPEPVAAS